MTSLQDKSRTRVLKAPQSKNGCRTCKYDSRPCPRISVVTRRVKCDEARPSCSRCVQAKRRCEGYNDALHQPTDSPPSASARASPNNQSLVPYHDSWNLSRCPPFSINLRPHPSSSSLGDQDRLAHLGCSVLFDRSCRDLASRSQIWNRFLPQLSHAVPVVNAAAAALGAVYEAHTLFGGEEEGRNRVAGVRYGAALRRVQADVGGEMGKGEAGAGGRVALLIACALLSCVEILRDRRGYALLHFEACARILTGRVEGASSSSSTTGSSSASETPGEEPWEDALSLQFMALDIQKASYVLGAPPLLSPTSMPSILGLERAMESIDDAELLLVRLIHSSYHFTAKASEHKYTASADVPREMVVEQGRYLAMMKQWLDGFNTNFLPLDGDSAQLLSLGDQSHARVLRAQCLSTIIYIATVMSAQETSYDIHGPQFERIVQDVTLILSHETHDKPEQRFRLFPGVVQPLFFTAVKYRHGDWRRQASSLLRLAGQEGPWDGNKMAVVTARAREVEEENCLGGGGRTVLPHEVSERNRIHGCAIHSPEDEDGPGSTVSVDLSRCYDVENMVKNYKTWEDKSNWETWEEKLVVR